MNGGEFMNVGEELIKVFIYPSQAEMLSVTEEYMAKNYESYYKSFTKKRWNIHYEKKIYPTVCIITRLLNLIIY